LENVHFEDSKHGRTTYQGIRFSVRDEDGTGSGSASDSAAIMFL
jgi:hypothetical protein